MHDSKQIPGLLIARQGLPLLASRDHLSRGYSRALVISDESTYPLYGGTVVTHLHTSGLESDSLLVPVGERTKTLNSAASCWERMHAFGLDRRCLVVALGGGVVTDLAGFVASCYMRGVDHINVPTTLMGMVDAAIGGKTGVNLPSGKNLVGTFFLPKLVVIALETLATLPAREVRAGLAEVIKYAFIANAQLLQLLTSHMAAVRALEPETVETVVHACCAAKVRITQEDPREQTGVRALLNFGHTFGHAIESMTGYERYLHGEAVAIGMSCGAQLSQQLGLIPQDTVDLVDRLCASAGLSTVLPADVSDDQLVEAMRGDKKCEQGRFSCIVLLPGSKAEKRLVEEQSVRQALRTKRERDGGR